MSKGSYEHHLLKGVDVSPNNETLPLIVYKGIADFGDPSLGHGGEKTDLYRSLNIDVVGKASCEVELLHCPGVEPDGTQDDVLAAEIGGFSLCQI